MISKIKHEFKFNRKKSFTIHFLCSVEFKRTIILELGTLGHILVTVKRIMIIKMQILGSKFLRISLVNKFQEAVITKKMNS